MNQIESIREAGRKAGRARYNGDESLAKFETEHALKMIRLEDDPEHARFEFNKAYRDEVQSLRI
ncbi:MAG: hypothetical protein ACXABY_13140 [Candidatus Thorarchaeota archaeon]|jgi:hypothetical protein